MKRSLIVIDMQQGSFPPYGARYDADGVVSRINQLARRTRSADGSVIFVQHDGPPGDPHHPDAPGWHLLSELETHDGDRFVRKQACDAFLNTNLADLLASPSDGQVIITGCATEFCVDTTVRSALARGYRTIVPADAHTTADRPYLTAEKIIEHHNAVWSAFLSPAGPAVVCASAEAAIE